MLTLNVDDPLFKDNTELSKKKKQKLVKHKRKNWKKTDIDEVEQGIEDLRQQKRTGGVLSEKKDEDLFYIHKEKISNEINEDELQPRKKKRLSLEEKLQNLNCYKNLKPDEASHPAHIVNENKAPKEDSKRQQKLRERQSKLKNKSTKRLNTKKEVEKENTVILNLPKKKKLVKTVIVRPEDRKNVIIESNFEKDIWNKKDDLVINEVNEYYLRSTKKLLTKRPNNPVQPKSAVTKLEIPHPGASYNPDYDDHQELLLKAHLIELEKLKKEEKEMRKFTTTVKKMSWDEIEKVWLEEMAVDSLFNRDNPEAEKDEKEEETQTVLSNKKLSKKKESTNKKKRKQLLEKIKLKQKENEKQQRIQQNEIYRLRSIKKEISEEEKKKEEERSKKEAELKHKELFMPKRLGSLKYEEPEIELKLSNEITGNLRNLKPEGNIMMDRYKSLQKRNIIEPREKAKSQKKYWKKKFEKKNAYEKTYFIK